ncbi:GNAT family N-acetyltransferase [Anaerolinea thermophila]|uniref:Acetyltransferase n=2 Tax=Anaerolinea TaxID=233189 RepID=E8N1Y1_ANATU|nr:putative acetyltransferase [Anaerolinea thermophila UNI-1]
MVELIAMLTMPGLVRLKAVAQNEMIGFVGGDVRPQDNVGWVATLGVLPAYRGMGVGRALLRACEEKLRLRTPVVRLSVRRSNHIAIALYESAGYSIVDVWRGYYFDREDALVFEKKFD